MQEQDDMSLGVRVHIEADKTIARIYRNPSQPPIETVDFPAGTTKEQALAKIVERLKK